MTQRQWFKLHGWCSLPIWILFCFICITGTIAVFSHELTWL
ncbi:MAG TPA: PepSY domain-containing protein, partial [Idiomarina sp.]|nr:PepSY domain-containing protein [Idiomarina sp.]